jgi:hypothetical protein
MAFEAVFQQYFDNIFQHFMSREVFKILQNIIFIGITKFIKNVSKIVF